MTAPDDANAEAKTGHGPEIIAGLRESKAAFEAGDADRSKSIVDDLRDRYGDVQVNVVIGALKLGFISLDSAED